MPRSSSTEPVKIDPGDEERQVESREKDAGRKREGTQRRKARTGSQAERAAAAKAAEERWRDNTEKGRAGR